MLIDNSISSKIREKLSKSSAFYATLVQRKKRDMEIASGNFWSPDLIEETDRSGRICRHFSQYMKFMNAIVSPFSKSPYHAELEDPDGIYKEVQEKIDEVENDNNSKFVFLTTLRHACLCGAGFFVMDIIDGKVKLEAIRDVGHVALDPNCTELDGSDCEYAAIVDYISNTKAKRLYGDNVVNSDGSSVLTGIGEQWTIPSGSVPIVSFYEMNEKGTVTLTKACGNLIIQDEIELPITRIPIFRFCYNEIIRNNKVDYGGIVDLTADLQFGLNLAYSTMLERANRTPKASYLMPAKALDGLEEYYRKLQTKESLVALYNGDVAPTPLIESYQTQDLISTMQACNDLMASTIGVPSEGIQPQMSDQTATQILMQQANSESNVNSLYENAYQAIFSFTKALCELFCWELNIEKLPTYKLVNGPTIITKLQKRRQQLLAVTNLLDDKSKKIVAKNYIETLDEDIKDKILPDIIANSEDIMWVSDMEQKADPVAVNTLNQMNDVLNQTQDALEQALQANDELKKEIDQLNLQLLNQKEQILKDMIFHEDEMKLKEAELGLDAQEKQVEIDAKQGQANVQMTKELISLEKEKMKLAAEQQKEINNRINQISGEFDYANNL